MIEVSNLSYTYPSAKAQVLSELSFRIGAAEIFGFLGPSGAGKSTTQKILYKILSDYSGTVAIKGKDLNSWGKEFFEFIGVGFEFPNHYLKLSGLENLRLFSAFYPNENIQNFESLFELVGLKDDIHKKVEAYSKGMKMRLNFIRAIMHNPDILFFDEPTAGLDPGNAKIIKEHIKMLRDQGKTIFITTHNMNTADELCDRVSFISNGKLLLTESPKKLKHDHGKDIVQVVLKNGNQREFPLHQLGSNPQFLNYIKTEDIYKINSLEATLEEVFIKITGQSLCSESNS